MATCTAHCGGNTRLLWPRPTENVVLGDDSVILHLQQIEFVTVNTSDQETKDLLEHAKDVFIGEYCKVSGEENRAFTYALSTRFTTFHNSSVSLKLIIIESAEQELISRDTLS